jgi:hypothetical protein
MADFAPIYEKYLNDLKAISFPDKAKADADTLIKAVIVAQATAVTGRGTGEGAITQAYQNMVKAEQDASNDSAIVASELGLGLPGAS